MSLARRGAVAISCAALAASCGSSPTLPSIHLDRSQPGTPSTLPGRTVLQFVQAARSGDAGRMWLLLSEPTRNSIGPTLGAFARGTAPDLAKSLEDFRDERVLVSRQLDAAWAVGAVRGRYEQDGDAEPAAYAAALRREGDRWKLELDGLVIAGLRPSALDRTGDRPEIRAEAQAGGRIERMLLWVDGDAAGAGRFRTSPFSAELRGRPSDPLAEGEHALVVFAATEDTAAALAWTFEVG